MNRRLGGWPAIVVVAPLVALLAFVTPAIAAAEPTAGGTLIAAAGVVFIAALLSSIAGFAFSALASTPLLFLFGDPPHAVAVMIACSIAIQAYCVWALRRQIVWRSLWPFVAPGALTVPLGAWLLAHTPPALFAIGLGVFLIAYAAYMLLRGEAPVLRGGRWCDALAGALGGIAGGVAGFPGSVVTIWCGMRGWSKEHQRTVYQPYILLMQLEALACIGAQAPAAFAPEIALAYMPVALIAAYSGLAVFRRLTTPQFTLFVNGLLLVSGVALFSGAL